MREEIFGIASFRSRQQVLQLESALRRVGVPASIVTTPRDVALGCGCPCGLNCLMPARFGMCINMRAREI